MNHICSTSKILTLYLINKNWLRSQCKCICLSLTIWVQLTHISKTEMLVSLQLAMFIDYSSTYGNLISLLFNEICHLKNISTPCAYIVCLIKNYIISNMAYLLRKTSQKLSKNMLKLFLWKIQNMTLNLACGQRQKSKITYNLIHMYLFGVIFFSDVKLTIQPKMSDFNTYNYVRLVILVCN